MNTELEEKNGLKERKEEEGEGTESSGMEFEQVLTQRQCPGFPAPPPPATALEWAPTRRDFSYIHFQEDSYVEFQGFHLHPQNNISLEFQTTGFQGVLLYIEQRPTTVGRFFIQLYINHGFLQYQFACDVQEEIRNISTNVRVNDGRKYKVRIRQDLVRCEAEVTLLGITTEKSIPSNHWSSLIWQATGPIFIGGLPHRYARKQVTGSMCNFTGCLEITEINNIGPFTFRKALDRHNIKSCRFSLSEGTSAAIKGTFSGESEAFKAASSSPTHPGLLSACPENLCQNGGTCQQINLPGSVASFQCDCPLHFTGRFCEKGKRASLFCAFSNLRKKLQFFC
ncbi:protein eyes shut homolog [Pogona vitticeps]